MLYSKFYNFAGSLDQAIQQYKEWYSSAAPHFRDRRMLTVKYEDLKSNTACELKRVFRFIGLEEGGLDGIIEDNRDVSKVSLKDVFRKGTVDSYKEDLEQAAVARIETELRAILVSSKYLSGKTQGRLGDFFRCFFRTR
jgi:hypothetical protein